MREKLEAAIKDWERREVATLHLANYLTPASRARLVEAILEVSAMNSHDIVSPKKKREKTN